MAQEGMTYRQLVETQGFSMADFLSGDTVIDSGSAEQNVNGDGKLTLSWKGVGGGGIIPAGTMIDAGALGKYILADHYVPVDNGDGTCTYSPSFISEDYQLTGILFYMNLQTEEGGSLTLYTFPYTGTIGAVCNQLAAVSGFSVQVGIDPSTLVTVSFDGDNCKSAAQKIASAAGVSVVFTGGHIGIGTAEAYSPDEYFDRFVVLGGTRNMGRKTISGYYATVTQRLTLPDSYPGSVMGPQEAIGHRTKLLINDSIYPKKELTVTSATARKCYMLNENGEKIIDKYEYVNHVTAVYHHTDIVNGVDVYRDEAGNQIYPVYKQYAKWYITLGIKKANGGYDSYNVPTQSVIAGCPLGILFQSGQLTGREFDLAYFDRETTEHGEDDVDDHGFTARGGMCRIIMQADGSVLLPGEEGSGMCPAAGDRVTLINMALDQDMIDAAKSELEAWGQGMAHFFSQVTPASFQMQTSWNDFLLEGGGSYSIGQSYSPGGGGGSYIITSVKTDLVSGRQTVTYGTFKKKGLMQSLVDKVEGASLQGGGGILGSDSDYRHTAPLGIDSFNALHYAGGNAQMVGINQRISNATRKIDEVYAPFNEVMQQADRKFDIWYGNGTPYPYISSYGGTTDDKSNAEANYPASGWATTEEKRRHVQDIYYDMLREPGLAGGTAWRWTEKNGKFYWEDITDSQTLASLEKISDVASDGKITGGVEKMRVFIDWMHACEEYRTLTASKDYAGNGKWTAYENAFLALAKTLNGGTWTDFWDVDEEEGTADIELETYPLMLRNLSTTTILGETDAQIAPYYNAWRTYYEAVAALNAELARVANANAAKAKQDLANIANDNIITADEKTSVLIPKWQEVIAEKAVMEDRATVAKADMSAGSAYQQYMSAFRTLGGYLNDKNQTVWNGTDDPVMLNNGADTDINRETFNSLWAAYYSAREALLTAVSVRRESYYIGGELPRTPDYKGDLWMKVSADNNEKGTLFLCVRTNETPTPSQADWEKYNINVSDPKMLLAVIAEGLHYMGLVTESQQTFTLETVSSQLHVRRNGAQVDESHTLMPSVADSFSNYVSLTGNSQIRIFTSRPDSPQQYDLYITELKVRIRETEYTGKIYIEMYNGDAWEILMSAVGSVMENLGNAIKLLVFGNDVQGNPTVTELAGQVIAKSFIKLFAEAKMQDPVTGEDVSLAEALFGITIDPVLDAEEHQVYKNGLPQYTSTMKMQADRIEFKGTMNIKDDDGNTTFKIDSRGQVESQGSFLSASNGIYSRLSAGSLELGTYTEEDGEDGEEKVRTFTPVYRFGVTDTDNKPVLGMVDDEGNPLGMINEQLFSSVERFDAMWTSENMVPVNGDVTWNNVNGSVVTLYLYTQGFERRQRQDGTSYRVYTLLDGTESESPDPQLHNRWFTARNAALANRANGRYAEDIVSIKTGTDSNGNITKTDYKRTFVFTDGAKEESTIVYGRTLTTPVKRRLELTDPVPEIIE